MKPTFFMHAAPKIADAFCLDCARVAAQCGFEMSEDRSACSVAIAPWLTRKLLHAEYQAPMHGTLIFHPSALPYRRGRDSIKHTVRARERVSAATWFWASDGFDEGPICEQEVVVLLPGESAGRAYYTRFLPAGLVALQRALMGVYAGRPRRVAQDHALATYDPPLQTTDA